jgi:hypothetical protein
MFTARSCKTKQSVGSGLPAHVRSPDVVSVLVDVLELVAVRVVVVVAVVPVLELVEEVVVLVVTVLVLDDVLVLEVVVIQVSHSTGQSIRICSRISAMLLVQRCFKSVNFVFRIG